MIKFDSFFRAAFSRGRISAPFPIENSRFFSQYHVCFSQLRKVRKKYFFKRPLLLTYENKWPISEWYLCLSSMVSIRQSIWGYILLPLLCSMSLISPNLLLSRSFFPNFDQGHFPKIAGKSPVLITSAKYVVGTQKNHLTEEFFLSTCTTK